jgi:DNA-binding MarR family transcriptional regulator
MVLGKEEKLLQARELTQRIRQLEKDIVDASTKRALLWRNVWEEHEISQREIAEKSNVVQQTVYMQLRKNRS